MKKNELLDIFNRSQENYIEKKSRKHLKSNSQFFTPPHICKKMLETINWDSFKEQDSISLLEPAAGCGILILETVFYIIKKTNINKLFIDVFELDSELFNILNENLNLLKMYFKKNHNIEIIINLYNENFILFNSDKWKCDNNYLLYDIIVSNPPFKKINQSSDEALLMKDLVHGQPNIYTLFIAMSLKLLKKEGVFSVISPRNYLVGIYSKKIRNFIFNNYSFSHIHTFDNRNLFKFVNQEIIISTYVNKRNTEIQISRNGDSELKINFNNIIFDKKNNSIFVPNDNKDLMLVNKFLDLEYTLDDIDIKVSVGPIVQFRNQEYLRKNIYSGDYAPLLINNDIVNNNEIIYFSRKNSRKTHNKSIHKSARCLIKNSNYLILRKVTAKDDKNILISSVLSKDFFQHELLGLDNNLLYFHRVTNDKYLSLDECYGLFCIINSKQFQSYYYLINGTHTINVSDFKNMRFPNLDTISSIGCKLRNTKKYTKEHCSDIVSEILTI
ncbi:Eco57I restriction-modification methylase domain-containing protein [Sporosalibacterium faouarense]|uniref:Eco57I restriction-modification methylase domain-containing protein n=1 Tax=Sporosalibacterium faouarense TaxID=516123 RepID=UPI00192C93EF|nr:N-6 DNA methylase [Sporosalibacterium faouarense]